MLLSCFTLFINPNPLIITCTPTRQVSFEAACVAKEAVVRRYFEGVNLKDYAMIRSCFAPVVTLRDMCGLSKVQ